MVGYADGYPERFDAGNVLGEFAGGSHPKVESAKRNRPYRGGAKISVVEKRLLAMAESSHLWEDGKCGRTSARQEKQFHLRETSR